MKMADKCSHERGSRVDGMWCPDCGAFHFFPLNGKSWQVPTDDWQDEDRTTTTNERQLSCRYDCRAVPE